MLALKQTITYFFLINIIIIINCDSMTKSSKVNFKKFIRFVENILKKSNKTFEVPDLTKIIDEIPLEVTQNIINEYNNGLGNEDIYLDVTQLIQKYEFKSETHHLQTKDGYVLTMHRIPGKGKPVFLMHCLEGSSDDWVTAGPESGIAYSLAREGYDVWMGNARGNKYSRKHISLNPGKPEFWDFSWEEIGLYDLPVFIDYVLNETRVDKLTFIGHSQGTTAFYVLCSMMPEYNDKITLMISLSAVAYMSHVVSPLVRLLLPLVYFWNLYKGIAYEFPPNYNLTRNFENHFCGHEKADIFCINMVFLLVGFDNQEVNATNLPVFFGHVPAGAATKQYIHYGQEVLSGKFRRFDYGYLINFEHYGYLEPPDYPVEKITAPIAIFHSKGDWLAAWEDVSMLIEKLSNVVACHRVPDNFNHLDFVWAKNVQEYIYKPMCDLIKKFS